MIKEPQKPFTHIAKSRMNFSHNFSRDGIGTCHGLHNMGMQSPVDEIRSDLLSGAVEATAG